MRRDMRGVGGRVKKKEQRTNFRRLKEEGGYGGMSKLGHEHRLLEGRT